MQFLDSLTKGSKVDVIDAQNKYFLFLHYVVFVVVWCVCVCVTDGLLQVFWISRMVKLRFILMVCLSSTFVLVPQHFLFFVLHKIPLTKCLVLFLVCGGNLFEREKN